MIRLEPAAGPADGRSVRKAELRRFLARIQSEVGLRGRVDVLLASDETLRRLNREFRRKDTATDVLSFPAADGHGEGGATAGDIAISLDTAQRQAAEQGHPFEAEIKILLLHGALHLAGHDHERNDDAMVHIEKKLRLALGLPAGLIERAAHPQRRRSE